MNAKSPLGCAVLMLAFWAMLSGGVETRVLGSDSPAPANQLTVEGIPSDAPIAIEARATATELRVDLVLEPEWHVYRRDVGGGRPVTLTMELGSAIVAAGELQLPPSDSGKLVGKVPLSLPIEFGIDGKSTHLEATLRLQVCDALMCLPPMEVKIRGEIPALNILLVVGEDDERTARIRSWLESRGFEVTTKTYASVEANDCDAHDVVLADSNVFGKTKASRTDVHRFPKTETPLIAVGFNGTELIEAHEIAMTSGYI